MNYSFGVEARGVATVASNLTDYLHPQFISDAALRHLGMMPLEIKTFRKRKSPIMIFWESGKNFDNADCATWTQSGAAVAVLAERARKFTEAAALCSSHKKYPTGSCLTTADNVAAARTELDLPAPAATADSPSVPAPAAASPTVLALPDPGFAAAEHKSDADSTCRGPTGGLYVMTAGTVAAARTEPYLPATTATFELATCCYP
jgi:hypothetical protein